MGVDKLYESENYILVNKPFDMYINSDDENEKNTVSQHIGSPDSHLSCSDNPLHFVQRLDYSTSGVLCIAKNKSAAARAGKLFEKRETRKYYLAIVRGHVKFDVADIEFDVGMDPLTATSSHRMVAATSSTSTSSCVEARKAQTRLLALELGTYDSDPATIVLLKPITGRRHQLRVHCAAVEHTILGDYTYSNRLDSAPHRMFLHANRLILPLQTEPLDIQTPEPFFSDTLFTSKWKSEKVMHKYRGDDFKVACDTIDASYVVGLKYARFNRVE